MRTYAEMEAEWSAVVSDANKVNSRLGAEIKKHGEAFLDAYASKLGIKE